MLNYSSLRLGPVLIGVVFGLLTLAHPSNQANAADSVLDTVKERGFVICGVSRSGSGLSELTADGSWNGFFAEFCKVLGAAVLGDKDAVEYVEVSDLNRFEALNEGAIDVLMANTTWTATRDSQLGLAFTTTVYYDGQGFLAHRELGADNIGDVDSARVCVNRNTTTLLNLEDLIAAGKSGLEIVAFDATETLYSAFFTRRCDIVTYDRVVLRALQLYRAANPDDLVLFSDVISKEPLGPAVRQGDPKWFDAVQWSVFATIAAEELGLNSDTVGTIDTANASQETRRFLGKEGQIGANLGLPTSWAHDIVEQVGNYGEIYRRYLGGTKGERGLNALWRDGGLLYAPPFR